MHKTRTRQPLATVFVLAATFAGALAAAPAQASSYWTGWVSEEDGSPVTGCRYWDEGATGFGCSGRYCDSVRLYCQSLPNNASLDPSHDYWTSYFSEEDSGIETVLSEGFYRGESDDLRVCYNRTSGGIVSGIRCSGSYCDSISLECSAALKANGSPMTYTNCGWTPAWYSEEQGSVDFGWNRFITGVWCDGSYCDNKKFYVCSTTP